MSTDPHTPPPAAGQRGRIVPPQPPAPVPAPRATTVAKKATTAVSLAPKVAKSEKPAGGSGGQSDSDVVRSTGSMAIATLVSRITGFLRTLVLSITLGPAIGSAFNTANTLPNLVTEIVLGAVLSSLVVPVLVRAEKEDPDQGATFIRHLLTMAMTILIAATVLSTLGAPLLTKMILGDDSKVNITQSVSFAYLLLPQILFYGLSALFMAILNTKGVFKPGAWAPVWNNIVVLGVMAIYWFTPGGLTAGEQAGVTNPHILLLGLGTTLGVVVQAAVLIPPARKLGIDLRPLWGIDDRLKQFSGMAAAIIVYVAISQAGYMITTHIAGESDARAPMIYQQAWLLLQMPYGIIGVTLLTAIMPRLSRNAADGDHTAVVRDLTLATKLTYLALIPIIVFLTVFGVPISHGLFAYLEFNAQAADLLGLTLSFSAFTLIPYALVLLHLRVFYAREEAWTPTFIIGGITITKVSLSYLAVVVASSPSRVVVLLGAANGFGFIAGAVLGALLLKRKLGTLNLADIARTTAWALGASAIGAFVAKNLDMAFDYLLPGVWAALGSAGFLVRVCIAGVVFLIVTGVVLAKSRLAEVNALGRSLTRLPGLRRFAPAADDVATPDAPEQAENTIHTIDPFQVTGPELPPMSAGFVRPPRLVAGAPVANGRFRLIKSHGHVPGARFWQAREQTSGKQVALVFVDTAGAPPLRPVSPAAAAAAAAEVARRTRKLASLKHPALAGNPTIFTYRAGCVVVADWIPGSPLGAVTDVEPGAAASALVPLAEATSAAAAAGIPLGLDDTARLRVDETGTVRLAFPAVLPGASIASDITTTAHALDELLKLAEPGTPVPPATDPTIGEEHPTPTQLPKSAAEDIRDVYLAPAGSELPHGPLWENVTPDTLHSDPDTLARLLGIAGGHGLLSTTADATPTPDDQDAGFGGRTYSRRALFGLVTAVVALMIIVALAVVYVLGIVGNDRTASPVNQDSVTKVIPDAPTKVRLIGATTWQPAPAGNPTGEDPNGEDTPVDPAVATLGDNNELAGNTIDDDPATAWRTLTYDTQFGSDTTTQGTGLLLTVGWPTRPTEITLDTTTPGTGVEIYGVPDGPFTTLDQGKLLGAAVLGPKATTINLTPTDTAYGRILVFVTRLPLPDPADITGITLKGKADSKTDKNTTQPAAPAPAPAQGPEQDQATNP